MIRIFRHYISRAYLWLLLIEFCVFFTAICFGSYVHFLMTKSLYTMQEMTYTSIIFSSVIILSRLGLGLYNGRVLNMEGYNVVRGAYIDFSLAIFGVISVYYLLPEFHAARIVLVYAIIGALFGILITRTLFYKIINLERYKIRVLVIGSGEKAHRLIMNNDLSIHSGLTIVGSLALPDELSVIDQSQIISYDKEIIAIAEELKVDEIVIAMDDCRLGLPIDELLDCRMSGFSIMNIMGFYEREQGIISLENIYPSWLVFCSGFAQGDLRSIEKRFFDVFASLILLGVTWPLMLLTALTILLESGFKGSVLYRQLRVGEKNQNFELLKFRSMKMNAEKNGAQWAQQNDNRITPIGRFIRKYRIDELPQIFNVLRGNMSFVGPRPERPEFVQGFNKRIPYYRERHRVKPGITGWAQLCYPYGANENDTIQKLQYDLYYVKNFSLFLDFSIMLNTVEVILWGKGAR